MISAGLVNSGLSVVIAVKFVEMKQIQEIIMKLENVQFNRGFARAANIPRDHESEIKRLHIELATAINTYEDMLDYADALLKDVINVFVRWRNE